MAIGSELYDSEVTEDATWAEVQELKETLNAALAQIAAEDVNWRNLFGGANDETVGMTLDELAKESTIIRKFVDEAPLIGRAADLRQTYVWGKGVNIEGTEHDSSKRGRVPALPAFFNKPLNQEAIFSEEAKPEIEKAAATDGHLFLLGEKATKTLRRIPVWEMKDVYLNPNFQEEVWAYLREWTDYSTPQGKTKRVWIYTDQAPKEIRQKSIQWGGKRVDVDERYEILDKRFNRQVGRPLGVPDLYAAVSWNRTYVRMLKNGVSVGDAMAAIAFRATSASKSNATQAAMKLAQGGTGKAKIAFQGIDQELAPLATTGKTFDFNGIRPLAALVATAARVSIVHLLSDPGAAGSSYGSASNLDKPTLRAMQGRQAEWKSYLKRVLKWGTGLDVKVEFPPIEDEDKYRSTQQVGIGWGTGLLHPQEARAKLLEIQGIEAVRDAPPEGVMLPNNEKSLARKDIDTDAQGNPSNGGGFTNTQGSGGTFTGARDATDRDARVVSDTVSESMAMLNLDRLQELVERLEAAKSALE